MTGHSSFLSLQVLAPCLMDVPRLPVFCCSITQDLVPFLGCSTRRVGPLLRNGKQASPAVSSLHLGAGPE